MDDTIAIQIRQILYTNPQVKLSPVDIEVFNTLPIDAVREIFRTIYTTETNSDVIGKTYTATLALDQLDKVQFFIDIFETGTPGWRTSYCFTLGELPDPRAIAKLCQVLLEDPDPSVRYFAIEAVTNFGDTTALSALAYARDHETDLDYEGVPLADTAQWAIDTINHRITLR